MIERAWYITRLEIMLPSKFKKGLNWSSLSCMATSYPRTALVSSTVKAKKVNVTV